MERNSSSEVVVGSDILTVEEISNILRIGKNTIHSKRWQEKSRCPLFKQGKRLYVTVGEFHRWFRGKAQFVEKGIDS